MLVPGIDVSHYQGAIDWPQVAGGGVVFCFVKATEGIYVVDPFFKENWAGCAGAGLLRGAYHFGRPGTDAQTQAQQFFSTVGTLGPHDLPPVLDIETLNQCSAEDALQWVLDFTAAADTLFGRRTMVYTDDGFWQNLVPILAREPAAARSLAARPLWLADYVADPTVPSPWQAWSCWQYSDGSVNGATPVPGVAGDVDQNWFQQADLESLTSPLPPPQAQGSP
ncbi:glycoside hydrolase family 25 protein [Polaromonas sp. YR568]|uniref:glycoside hydrolase family 25 protein n=1 Tax=Polaromonas sp. YR568 TaxID=1855301 RepID=UPI00398BDD68